jgi:hypothetical protein
MPASHNHLLSKAVGVISIIAGLIHTTIVASQHWSSFPPIEGAFFVSIGIAQIIIGILFLVSPSLRTYYIGLIVNGGIALLYILLRYLPVPFVGAPEEFEMIGSVLCIIEAVAVTASIIWLITHEEHGANRKLRTCAASSAVIIAIAGFGFYGGAQGMTLIFPSRAIDHHHGDDHEMDHEMPDMNMMQDMEPDSHEDEDDGHTDHGH